MDHGINMPDTLSSAQRSLENAERLSTLLTQLSRSHDLLGALCEPELNIADLLHCDGAAVSLGDDIRLLEDGRLLNVDLSSTRKLINQLQQQPRQSCYEVDWQNPIQGDAASSTKVLALPFDRLGNGWLLWFRSAETAQAWNASELHLAETLRCELLEISLDQARAFGAKQRRLISTLGHGLCNPLQSISMSAALLKPHDQRSTDLREHINVASESMLQQIQRVLEVNRLHGGESPRLATADTNLSTLIASEVSRLRNTSPQLNLQASFDSDFQLMLDPDKITEAVRHLLNNAAQYATAGTPVSITLNSDPQNGDVVLVFSNYAATLPPAQLGSLLSAHRGGERDGNGPPGKQLGIGLFVTSRIAQAHGGSLNVQQSNGIIAFQLRLPARIRVGFTPH